MTPEEQKPEAKPEAELTDADLDKVAGGFTFAVPLFASDGTPVPPGATRPRPDPNPRGAQACE